jgi:hypothetical protein
VTKLPDSFDQAAVLQLLQSISSESFYRGLSELHTQILATSAAAEPATSFITPNFERGSVPPSLTAFLILMARHGRGFVNLVL